MFKIYPLKEEQKVVIVIGQLKDPALREVKAWADEERKTDEGIFKKFRKHFRCKNHLGTAKSPLLHETTTSRVAERVCPGFTRSYKSNPSQRVTGSGRGK